MEHSIAVRRKQAMVHNGAIVCRQSRCVIVHWLIVIIYYPSRGSDSVRSTGYE